MPLSRARAEIAASGLPSPVPARDFQIGVTAGLATRQPERSGCHAPEYMRWHLRTSTTRGPAFEATVLELDVGVALTSHLQQSFAFVNTDDIGSALVQPCCEPPVAAPKVENSLADDVPNVSIEESVEPVDIGLRRVPVGERIPQLNVP